MKKIILLLAISFTLFLMNQESQAQTKVGGGVSFGTWFNNPGLNVRADIGVVGNLSLVPMLDLYIPRFSTGTFLNSASLHFHYNIDLFDNIAVYPLAGATLKSYLDIDRVGYDRVYSKLAFNPSGGAGALLKITQSMGLFVESRLEFGSYAQFVLTGGVIFRPGR